VKALTVKEPWAAAIVQWGKDVENRSRPTKYRGQLYIHAGKAWDKDAPEPIFKITGLLPVASLGHGMVIGTVDLIDCHHADDCWTGYEDKRGDTHVEMCSEWAMPGHWHWELANPRPLACPFPETGKLGIWNLGSAP
jgi:hypothetical protein